MFENCQHTQTAVLFPPYCVKLFCHTTVCLQKFAVSGKKIPRRWAYRQCSKTPQAMEKYKSSWGIIACNGHYKGTAIDLRQPSAKLPT